MHNALFNTQIIQCYRAYLQVPHPIACCDMFVITSSTQDKLEKEVKAQAMSRSPSTGGWSSVSSPAAPPARARAGLLQVFNAAQDSQGDSGQMLEVDLDLAAFLAIPRPQEQVCLCDVARGMEGKGAPPGPGMLLCLACFSRLKHFCLGGPALSV